MSALRDDRPDDEIETAATPARRRELLVDQDERLIVEDIGVNGREMTRYRVVTRDEWIASLPEGTPESVRRALALAGAWKDDDPDEAAEFFDRIRRESKLSPPIEFDDDDVDAWAAMDADGHDRRRQ